MFFTNVDFSVFSGDFQAFMSFLPSEISGPKAGGKFKVMLSGAKNYIYTMTSAAGVQYKEGKRYKANIDMSETAKVSSGAYMSYTIKTTEADDDVPLGLSTSSQTAPAKLTIDWGDGNSSTIESGTAIGSSSNNTHKYAVAGTYTVTITSAEGNSANKQISDFTFYKGGAYNYLVSMDTPMLNSKQTDFSSCFYNCSSLASVPSGLFDKNTAVTDFSYCFYNCTKLVLNKNIFSSTGDTGRFKDKTVNFSSCFQSAGSALSAGSQGEAPELWKYVAGSGSFTKSGCFSNAYFTNNSTSSPDNYAGSWGTPK